MGDSTSGLQPPPAAALTSLTAALDGSRCSNEHGTTPTPLAVADACRALQTSAESNASAAALTLTHTGAVPLLARALREHPADIATLAAAGRALRELSHRSGAALHLCARDALPLLAAMARCCGDAGAIKPSLSALACLAVHDEANRAVLVRAGALSAAFSALRHHGDDPRVVDLACTVVANLVWSDDAAAAAEAGGATRLLIAALIAHAADAEVGASATGALLSVAIGSSSARAELCRDGSGALSVLVALAAAPQARGRRRPSLAYLNARRLLGWLAVESGADAAAVIAAAGFTLPRREWCGLWRRRALFSCLRSCARGLEGGAVPGDSLRIVADGGHPCALQNALRPPPSVAARLSDPVFALLVDDVNAWLAGNTGVPRGCNALWLAAALCAALAAGAGVYGLLAASSVGGGMAIFLSVVCGTQGAIPVLLVGHFAQLRWQHSAITRRLRGHLDEVAAADHGLVDSGVALAVVPSSACWFPSCYYLRFTPLEEADGGSDSWGAAAAARTRCGVGGGEPAGEGELGDAPFQPLLLHRRVAYTSGGGTIVLEGVGDRPGLQYGIGGRGQAAGE